MSAAPGFAGYITGAVLLGESARSNSQTDTTGIHSYAGGRQRLQLR